MENFLLGAEIKFSQSGLDKIVAETKRAYEQLAALAKTAPAGETRANIAATGYAATQRVEELARTSGADLATINSVRRAVTAMDSAARGLTKGRDAPADFKPIAAELQQYLKRSIPPGGSATGHITATEQKYLLSEFRSQAAYQANAQKGAALGISPYAAGVAADDVQRRQVHAEIMKGKAADERYAQATAEAAISKRQISAQIKQALGADDRYATATAELAKARDVLRARTNKALQNEAGVRAYGQAEAEEQRLRQLQRQAVLAATSSPDDIRREAQTRVDEDRRRATIAAERARLQDPRTLQGRFDASGVAATKVAEERRAAFIRESVAREQAADTEYIKSKAAAAEAERLRAAKIRAARYGLETEGQTVQQLEAQSAIRGRIEAEQQATAVARAQIGQDASLGGQLAAARAERIAAEREAAVAAARAAIVSGQGTTFQRLQSKASLLGPNPRAPQEFAGLGGFVGQKALTTAGYAIPGALLYGGISAIGQLVDQAKELERIMVAVESQFEAVGDENFETAKQSILDIARNTGVAADEVANVFFQFRGAFGDTAEALEQTEAAMKLVTVTGLSAKEVIDSLTATTKTFADSDGTAKPIEEIGNAALALEQNFGVTANETVTFVADLAAVGATAGASAEELAGLGAASQQLSGRSGSALAEAYGRVLPALEEAKASILSLYQAPDMAAGRDNILDAFASGDTFEVFKQLLRDIDMGKLTEQQKQFALSLLGSRREAQALAPVFNNAGAALRGMNLAETAKDGTLLNDRFDDIRSTVQVTTQRMQEAFKQLGQALFQAGLADILTTAATAAGTLALALNGVFSVLSAINDVTGGVSGKILAATVVVGGFVKIMSVLAARRAATAAATELQLLALAGETRAETLNTQSANLNTAAEERQAAAKLATAGAATAQAGVLYGPNGQVISGAGGAAAAGGGLRASYAAARAGGAGRLASAGAALGPAGLATIGLAGLTIGQQFFSSQEADTKAKEQSLIEKIRTADREEMNEIAKQHVSFWDRIKASMFDVDLPDELVKQERARDSSREGRNRLRPLLEREGGRGPLGTFLRSNAKDIVNRFNQRKNEGKGAFQDEQEVKRVLAELAGAGTKYEDVPLLEGVNGSDSGDFLNNRQFESSDFSVKKIDKLLELARRGSPVAAEIVAYIAELSTQDEALNARFQEAKADREKNDRLAAAGGDPGVLAVQDADTAVQQYEAGAISGEVAIRSVEAAIRTNRELQARTRAAGGSVTAADAEALAKLEQTQREFYQKKAKQLLDQSELIDEATGASRGSTARGEFLRLLAFVGAKTRTGSPALSTDEKIAQIPELLEAAQNAFLEEVNDIADPLERARRLRKGTKLNPTIRRLIALSRLQGNVSFARTMDSLSGILGPRLQAIQDEAVDIALQSGRTVKEVLLEILSANIETVQKLIAAAGSNADIAGLRSKLTSLIAAKNTVLTQLGNDATASAPGTLIGDEDATSQADQDALDANIRALEAQRVRVRNDPVAAARIDVKIAEARLEAAHKITNAAEREAAEQDALLELEQARAGVVDAGKEAAEKANSDAQDIISAQANLARAQAHGDPAREAQVALSEARSLARFAKTAAERINAQAAIVDAMNQVEDAQADLVQSRFELLKALVGNNAYAAAQLDVGAAQAALAAAHGEAAKNRAAAALQEARRAQQNALVDTFVAINDTIAAAADAAGDAVKVAEIGVKNAKARLEVAINQGAGRAETENLRAELIRAQSQLRQSRFQDSLGDIEYLLEVERISTDQAIQMLRAMMQIPTNTEEMNRTLERRIRALQQELSQDFQFNLPDINIDGLLYQSRRLNETGTAGQTYQDNRAMNNITMEININSDADVEGAVAQIQQAINPSTPSGNVFGTYVGLY